MKQKTTLLLLLLLPLSLWADEGMWMLSNLDKATRREMKARGLDMPVSQLYNTRKASLKDAIVSFGGFCSGVVVSEDGLVFTNHHCGFSSIQQHSSVEHDLLRYGFVARNRSEELPNPELYVRFLLRTEDVTRRVLKGVTPDMDEAQRSAVVDSMQTLIAEEVSREDSTLTGVVTPYFGGNEYHLSVYRDYTDVRLVFAPPSSVGKFGWDTDNWEWPRHTGDFCVFRIYAGRDNRPADYSPDNVPYHPAYVAPISLQGYREGDFCMTLGYPGTTERYLSSFGIEEMMLTDNQAQIDVRGVKQAIWKQAMEQSDDIRIKYASKYDESSNYWKNSIGVNRAIRRLHVLEKKRQLEQEVRRRIQQTPAEREQLLHLFTDLELNYKQRREAQRAMAYFFEAFFYGPELFQQTMSVLNFDYEADKKSIITGMRAIREKYDNMDPDIDKEVFAAMLATYRSQVDETYLPAFYDTIRTRYGGNDRAFADSLYAHTRLSTTAGLRSLLEGKDFSAIMADPAVTVCMDLLTLYFEVQEKLRPLSADIERGERLFNAAVRRMYSRRNFYPDANSTMRLSFGTVAGYAPFDGAEYDYFTTTRGILEKARAHEGDTDFEILPDLKRLLDERDFGRYADPDGDLKVCFISNNDITGGNSGSAMFNARGELLGLAFDGNWEAMSSDILFEPATQRCIGVDVRYILFIIEKYGQAGHLLEELKLS